MVRPQTDEIALPTFLVREFAYGRPVWHVHSASLRESDIRLWPANHNDTYVLFAKAGSKTVSNRVCSCDKVV